MRAEFGIQVWRVHELLKDVVDDPEGRVYIWDRKVVPNEVGPGGAVELRAWMNEMDSEKLVYHLIGGVTVAELPEDFRKLVEKVYTGTEFVLPPLPNQLFTRDSSCWIYNGVTVNPMYWPARRKETLHLTAIYKYHPYFKDGDFKIWWLVTSTWQSSSRAGCLERRKRRETWPRRRFLGRLRVQGLLPPH